MFGAAGSSGQSGEGLGRLFQGLLGPRLRRRVQVAEDVQRVPNARSCNEGQNRAAGQPNQNIQEHSGHLSPLNCSDNRQRAQNLESRCARFACLPNQQQRHHDTR